MQELAGGIGHRAEGHEAERPTHRDPFDAHGRQLGHGRSAREGQDVHREVDGRDDLADLVDVGEARRVEHVGPGPWNDCSRAIVSARSRRPCR